MSKQPESLMRDRVSKVLRKANKAPTPVENSAIPGTWDLSYVEGWIELKRIKAWPKRPETFVRVPKFSKKQRGWGGRRGRAKGKIFFLLQVGRDWLLLDGALACDIVDRSTKEELISQALMYSRNGLDEKALLKCLS